MASAGYASTGTDAPTPIAATVLAPAAPEQRQEAWWRQSGDPVLTSLIDRGLTGDSELACRIDALHDEDRQAAKSARSLGGTLKRLFGNPNDAGAQAERARQVQRIALQRTRLSQRIMLAYINVRRLQQIQVLRQQLLSQYKDNAEIAAFRHEAGLVSAIDQALAQTQDQTGRAELGYTDGRLDGAIADLAALVGTEAEALSSEVGPLGGWPSAWTMADAGTTASTDNTNLAPAREAARHTVEDARSAYRNGAGDFATLYVAEVAALSVEQARIDTEAARISAMIRQKSASDNGWARAGLDQAVNATGANEASSCDRN